MLPGVTSTAALSHRSIGEVLALLKDEFPDITISKIRFLESQGLLDPERTPSGYRRFYDRDVERLRWILRQQRENFLPLKVIKGRLAEGADLAPDDDDLVPDIVTDPAAGDATMPVETAPAGKVAVDEHVLDDVVLAEEAFGTVAPLPAPSPTRPARDDTHAGPAHLAGDSDDSSPRRVLPEPALFAHRPPVPPSRSVFAPHAVESSVSLTAEELAAASGLTVGDVADLERFGLIDHRTIGSTAVYEDDALIVARTAAIFLSHGVEPRHLRMYKVSADRESGVFEQVILPLMRQRNPEARRRAADTLDELARLGENLHALMLRNALKNLT
jgi:DNA-binding transcriptional MerR regulator